MEELPGGYGSRYAIRIVPSGWTSEAGATFHVSVTGVDEPIEYDLTIVDCASNPQIARETPFPPPER